MANGTKRSGSRKPPSRKLAGLGTSTGESVRRATAVLEGELAAGLASARKAQQRFQRERKVDAEDLQEVLARFRADGHELVEVARELTTELRSDSTDALAQRLVADAHGALDTVLDLVTLAPDLVNRLLALADSATRTAQAKGSDRKGRGRKAPPRSRRPAPTARTAATAKTAATAGKQPQR